MENAPVNRRIQTALLLFLALILTAIIFAIDMNTSLGVAIGAMYCLVILYSWVLPRPFTPVLAGVLCTFLIILTMMYAPNTDEISHTVALNRLISVLVVWVCVSMMTIAKQSFEQLEKSKGQLELKVAERTKKLGESEASLKEAQKVAKIGSWEWFPDTNKVVWSDQMFEIFGIKREESTGTVYDSFQFIHPDDLERVKQTSEKAAREKQAIPIEYRIISGTGELKYLRGEGDQIVDEQGNLIKLFGTVQDITLEHRNQLKLEEYAENLETKNKELEQFTYITSHDLQEPLRTVTSMSDLLVEHAEDQLDDQARKFLSYITEASKRMSELVMGLMEYSRIGKNRELVEIDAAELISHVQDDLIMQITETGTKLEIGQLPVLKGLEIEMRLLFQNLIGNSIKFRKPDTHPHIKISAEKEKDFWKFSFTDNGIGIAEIHQDRIFTIFQRLHNKKDYEGTGIGLAHCQKIADLHGGKIWVESELGEGSTFYVTIPIDLTEESIH